MPAGRREAGRRRVMIARRHATAREVAALAGVSQSAVSRAFTPGASIAEETRARVVAAAARLGYRPNGIARSLTSGRTRSIGLVAAYLQNQFYPSVLEELARGLQRRDHRLLLFVAEPGRHADPLLEEVLSARVDGLILASTTLSSALAAQCRDAGIPVLLFNRTTSAAEVSSVTGENERGGRLIARFLAAGGHCRPAFIAGVEASSTSAGRERGFLAGCAEAGLAPPPRAVGEYTTAGAAAATRALLARPERPDALFVANDHMAIAAIEVARHEFGLRLPRDLSIIGFDDTETAAWPSYSLTSFSQPLRPMVERTVEMILDAVEGRESGARHAVIPGELVVRGSARIPAEGCVSLGGRLVWREESPA